MPTPNFADKTIWTGDNLDIMRGMNSESVDLIYLDPPFNSNQQLRRPGGQRGGKKRGGPHEDTWTLSIDLGFVAWMGLIADEQPATAHVLQTAGLDPRQGDCSGYGKNDEFGRAADGKDCRAANAKILPTGSHLPDSSADPTASHYARSRV